MSLAETAYLEGEGLALSKRALYDRAGDVFRCIGGPPFRRVEGDHPERIMKLSGE